MNKYHDTTKYFNPNRRFNYRRDEIFSNETGLSPNDIIAGIMEQDNNLENLSHPVRKAKAFEFVLKNTRIACDKRDIFPAINMIDRPLSRTVIEKWRNDIFVDVIPEIAKEIDGLMESGVATLSPDYDHSMPIWENIFKYGFKGLLDNSEKYRKKLQNENRCNEEATAFFDGIK
jgi:hypothetical protein